MRAEGKQEIVEKIEENQTKLSNKTKAPGRTEKEITK